MQGQRGGNGSTTAGMLARGGLLAGAALAGLFLLYGMTASTAAAKEQVGIYIGGEESEEEANRPKLEAESYPVVLHGESTSPHEFDFQFATLTCGNVEFFGDLTGAAAEFPLTTFFSLGSCKWSTGTSFTITANGCNDTVEVLNAGPPYVGAFGIECPPGKSFEFHTSILGTKCSAAIPPQSGLAGISFENVGAGSKRAVEMDIEVTELDFSLKGHPLICSAGEYENGTYTGSSTLRGYDE